MDSGNPIKICRQCANMRIDSKRHLCYCQMTKTHIQVQPHFGCSNKQFKPKPRPTGGG